MVAAGSRQIAATSGSTMAVDQLQGRPPWRTNSQTWRTLAGLPWCGHAFGSAPCNWVTWIGIKATSASLNPPDGLSPRIAMKEVEPIGSYLVSERLPETFQ